MLLDLSYAVSYLPSGTLWGGKLKTWQVGALGTISSVLGLYQSLSKKVSQKNSWFSEEILNKINIGKGYVGNCIKKCLLKTNIFVIYVNCFIKNHLGLF